MRTYVELQVDASPSGRAALTMLLPEDELHEHVRDIAPEKTADAALAAMNDREPSELEGASSWRARVAKAESSLEGGDLVELARVLRDFALQDADSGLSNSERRVADHIRDLVVGELVGPRGGPSSTPSRSSRNAWRPPWPTWPDPATRARPSRPRPRRRSAPRPGPR